MLKELQSNQNMQWLVTGDFNEILFQNEKIGNRQQSEQ